MWSKDLVSERELTRALWFRLVVGTSIDFDCAGFSAPSFAGKADWISESDCLQLHVCIYLARL